MRFLSASIITTAAIVASAPAAAQSTTLTATFSKGAVAEHSGNANRTDNGVLFSSLGIASMSISQVSANGSWGGSQGNDYAVTAKITFSNGTTTTFPAAVNWVRNAGGSGFDWVGITIGAGTTVNDGYNLTAGRQKTYVLAFSQSSVDLSALVPNDLDGSANTRAALDALNQYFPTAVASPPVITGPTGGAGATTSAISVNENQTGVTTLTASKQVNWAITSGVDAARFSISAGGVVTFLSAPDFENPRDADRNNTYLLTVQATDSNGSTATQTITVTVLNLDDTLPVVTPGQSLSYRENQVANAAVGTVAATDNAGVTAFRFAATSTQTSADGFYTIDNAGVVRITAAGVAAGVANNDFEIAPNAFTYGVQAGDAAGNWSAAANVALNVTDADDTAPVVAAAQSFSYAENRSANAQVGSVAASDAVGVTGFRFAATSTQTSADGFYTIDNAGVIRITAAGAAAGVANNDFEVAPNSFTYAVQAGDAAGNWSPATNISLLVTNLDDTAPMVPAGQSFSYAENRAAGAVLGTLAATDDTGVTGFRFTASGTGTSADGFYAVDASGRITLTAAGAAAGVATNDFEVAPNSFTYALQARDAAGNWSSSSNVALNVTNLDDSAPTVTAGQLFNYAENRAAGALLGTVAATDDTGVTGFRFTTTGTGTSSDGFFAIDASGRITLTAAGAAAGVAANDFETAPNSFTHGVQARDAAGSWSASVNVALNVTDLDDSRPTIAAGQTFSYAENRSANAVLGTVAASDDTAVTAFRFAGSGTGISADGYYSIDNGGVVRLTAAGAAAGLATNDFEVSPNSFTYAVEAGDAAGNWSTAANITLSVTDMDDTAPVVAAGQSFSYAENQAVNAQVGSVAASDAVGVTAFRFAASGTQTSPDGYYRIDNAGVIRLTAAGAAAGVATNDFETAPNAFTYGVEAGDAAGNWSAAASVTLNVTDANDTAPVIAAGQSFAYAENQGANAQVGTVAASDDVGVTAFRFAATGTGTSPDGYYTIDNAGAVRLTAAGAAAGRATNDFEVAPNSFTYAIEAGDAGGNWSSATNVAFSVTDLDDTAPVVGAGQSFSYSENQAANAQVATIAASDATGVTAFRFAASGTQTSSDGFYTIDNAGIIRLTAAGAVAGAATNDFETAPNSFTYGVEAGDAAGNWSAAANVVLNVADANDSAPVIGAGQSLSYAENQGVNAVIGTVAATDDVGVTSFRFAVTGTGTSPDGYFSIDGAGTVRLTAAGAASGIATNDFETAPNSFTYAIEAGDSGGNYSAATTVTFLVTDLDDTAPVIGSGQSFSYAENQSANAQVGTVAASDGAGVTAFRFAATGTQTSSDGYYTIDNGGVLRITGAGVASGIAANDFETAPNSFTYAVEAGDAAGNWSAAANVVLNVTDVADTAPVITGPGGSTGGTSAISVPEGSTAVTRLTANVPISRWAIVGGNDQGRFNIDSAGNITFVTSPDYEAPSDSDRNNSYILTVEAEDGNGLRSVQTITVTVTDLADTPPVITGPGGSTGGASAITVNEGTTAVTRLTANVPITNWAITGGNDGGRFTIDPNGNIAFATSPDYEAPSDSDRNNTYILTITATDGTGQSSVQTITVTVADLPDTPPVITGPGGSTGAVSSINVPEGTTAVTQLTANVPIASWSIVGGNDGGRFLIDGSGNITFTASPDFERPTDSDTDNSYVLAVEAVDGNGNRSSQTVAVNVTDVADTPPVISGPGGSTGATSSINVPEGTTAVTQLTANVPIGTWAITGGNDGGRFAIDANGNITFTASPDFERPADSDTDNSYVLVVEATDGNGNRSTQTVTVNVTDVADTPPVITGPGGSTGSASAINVPEGTTAVTQLTANVPITSWSITSGNDGGRFAIDANGNITFVSSPDYERPTDSDIDNIYVLTVTAVDATGQSTSQTVTVNVTDLPDTPPVITGPGGSTGTTSAIDVPEGTTVVTRLTANVPITSWSIVGGNDGGRFLVDGSGQITFTASPNYEAPSDSDRDNSYVLVIEGIDANGNKATQTVTVNVTDLPDTPPVITNHANASGPTATINVPEGALAVTTMTGNVPIASWAITGGNDGGRFSIDANGKLTFVAAPDYERPADTDADNSYVLVIEGTDVHGNKTSQTLTVNVVNVPDTPPAITGPSGGPGAIASAIAVSEGTAAVAQLTSNVPVTWSIAGGNDRGQFTINAQGQLSFVAAPNFEAPADSDRDNNYVLIIEAVDANGNRSAQTITVTVTDVDELQRRLDEIGDNLRSGLQDHAFSSLSTMLSFNEGLLGLDGHCASAGNRRPFSGGLNANERSQEASVRFARDLSSCEARTRVFVDGGVGFARVSGNWMMRGLASARLERRLDEKTVLGAALIGTAASDELGSFGDSRVSDQTLQLNLYGRTHLSERLRFAAFAGWGRSWYAFDLADDGLGVDGEMTGKRHLYGAALSGDIRFAGLDITTDAIVSRAVEKLGSAELDASLESESRSNMLFGLGQVDITRLSVPVHIPVVLDRHLDGREATRLDISPGVLCQDTAAASSALDCGYQLGLKFRLAPTIRSLIRAEARAEAVDGYLLNSVTVGYQRRFGPGDQLVAGLDLSQQGQAGQTDNRVMVRVGLGR